MKLISAKPHQTEIGSVLDVKFSLVGGEHDVSRRAKVVRQDNEFVLGLEFTNGSEEFRHVLWQHARFLSRLSWTWPLKKISNWFSEHKVGLRIAFTAMTFFIFTASVIYLFSDEKAGIEKRGWGQVYSDDVDLKYVEHYK